LRCLTEQQQSPSEEGNRYKKEKEEER
jgi:hypothetical protein